MAFTWDWMLSNLISYGLLNYYQCNICLNRTDICLYRMGKGMGPIVSEVHIIKRMSGSRYRVMSFDFDTVYCQTCKNAQDVCTYIIHVFVPLEFRQVPQSEYLRQLRQRRKERAAALKVEPSDSQIAGEFDWDIVKIREEMNDKINAIRWQRYNKNRRGRCS